MLWKDILAGLLIAGILAAFVPDGAWQGLFLSHLPVGWRQLAEALIGPLVAMLTFVCSIGNVPLAATLWGGGVGFTGVLAFLYADLIVLSLIDTYRRSFGWRMALGIAATLYVAMAASAFVVGGAADLAGVAPARSIGAGGATTAFAIDGGFWLNVAAIVLAAWLFVAARGRGGRDADRDGERR